MSGIQALTGPSWLHGRDRKTEALDRRLQTALSRVRSGDDFRGIVRSMEILSAVRKLRRMKRFLRWWTGPWSGVVAWGAFLLAAWSVGNGGGASSAGELISRMFHAAFMIGMSLWMFSKRRYWKRMLEPPRIRPSVLEVTE